jgi:DNA-binding NarL/FixJ family response regulator
MRAMPLALLLSPDDQAVSAITSVLEEMSVTCERPLDGASAAQKLNSNRFDLVLVDCENLPAAKLIFDVCRNRKGAGRPVPVAVVDGRAGLPTAFRLGAELILTKPVAKDQARITIRTAISRVKREDDARSDDISNTQSAEPAASATKAESIAGKNTQFEGEVADQAAPPEHAFAAAAATSPALTSFSDPTPLSLTPAASAPPASTSSASSTTMSMSAAVVEPDVIGTDSAHKTDSSCFVSAAGATSTPDEPRTANSLESRIASRKSPQSPANASTIAEPEESKITANAKTIVAAKSPAESDITGTETKPRSVVPATSEKEELKLTASEQKNEGSGKKPGQKSYGRLVTLLVLLVACGGFYGAWAYEPGFQALAKSQINHLLVVLGMAPQPQPHTAPAPAKPVSQTAKPSPGVPVQTTPDATQALQPTATDPNATPGTPSSSSPSISSTTLQAPSSPAATTTPLSKAGASSASPVAPAIAAPSSTATPTQPSSAAPKSVVTRIDLPPNAIEHPAATSGTKPVSKSTTPQSTPAQSTPPQH